MKWLRRLLAPTFIETSCFLIDRKLAEMGMEQEGDRAFLLLRISAIDSVRETWDDNGQPSHSECMISYRSGDSIVIAMGPRRMKLLLMKYGYL